MKMLFLWLMLPRILVGYLKPKTFFYVVYISVASVVAWGYTFGFTCVPWVTSASWVIARNDHQSFKIAKSVQTTVGWRFDLIF